MDYNSYKIATINIANISNPTKMDALKSFIRSAELDIVFLQEVQSKFLTIPGFNIIFNVDIQERGTAIATRDLFNVEHVEKSLDCRIISIRISSVTFIKIYAPSGALQRNARQEFYNNSVAHYLHHASNLVILGGDFNAVVNAKDATGNTNTSPMCKRLMSAAHLLDSWETLHGNKIEFSYIRANTASRLDRILVSSSMRQQLRTAHFAVTSFTDHKAYILRMALPHLGTPVGRGFWRLQTHILDNAEVLAEFERKWAYWKRARNNYRTWIDWWIKHAKSKVISFLKWQTALVHRNFRDAMELYRGLLQEAYNNLFENPEQLLVINRIKAQMLQQQRNFSNNFRRLNEKFISGEPTSLFHVAQVYGNRSKTTIPSLEIESGAKLTDSTQISDSIKSYFEQLYDTGETETSDDFQNFKSIPHGTLENENIMQPITTDEILSALKTSASRKSPGLDGLPKEFYEKVWNIINEEFTHIINDARSGKSTKEYHDGIIVLVKKKGTDKTVKGYRPISLLNFDYKLFARILKQRMHKLMPLVLSEHQKCSNGKRSIYEATCRILDEISQLKHRRRNSLLVSFDLDHAFDRVSHGFLKETMTKMNFNGQLVQLLGSIWNQSFSKILVNGRLTQELKIQRSVRQGDPLSMHLFVIYLQPMLDTIKQNFPRAVLNAYADDISMFLDNETELTQIVEIFTAFGRISGAVLNVRKTVAIMIGSVNLTEQTEWLSIETHINILGVLYGEDIRQARKLNWENVLRGIKTRLWYHNPRKLNIIQKVILLNTYISSKLWYMSSNIAITKGYIKKIKTEFGKFLWHGQPLQRVAYTNLTLPKDRGGINLQCVEQKSNALLANRLMSLREHLPFLSSLLEDINFAIPSMCTHITVMINVMSTLPAYVRENTSSGAVYQHLISNIPDPGFVAAQSRDWKAVFNNLHTSRLTSAQRSTWYMIMHKKIRHRELLFLRNVVEDPNCESCPGEPDTVVHKLFRCQHNRTIWQYQRRQFVRQEQSLARYEPEDFIYPNLRHLSRRSKLNIIQGLARFFCYITETPDQTIGLEHFEFYLATN